MEVSLTPEQEAQLQQLAKAQGCALHELLQQAVQRYLDQLTRCATEAEFSRGQANEGSAAFDCGIF